MKLRKELGLLDVFSICTGAMLSGLFILPGLAYAKAGPSVLLSYGLGALLAVTGLLSQGELASAMPKAGGTYFYVTRSMGAAVGTIYGLITWLSLSLKSAYELVFMGAIGVLLLKLEPWLAPLIAMGFCLLFLGINLVGVKEAGRVQGFLVFGLLAAVLFFVGRGIEEVDVHFFQPFDPHGADGVVAAAGFVFISFGGLLKVASIAEEVRDPGRVLPLGMIISLLVVSFVYLSVVFVTIGVLGHALTYAANPVAEGAAVFLGPVGRICFSVAAILAIVSSSNAGIMSASRYPLALARDEILPRRIGAINEKYQTPHVSILVTGLVIVVALFVKVDALVKAASSVLILTYLFSCLAVVILRESRLQNYRPSFVSPLYPWVQAVGILGFIVLLFELGRDALAISLAMVGAGLFVYWFFARIRTTRESALLHLVERITSTELTSHSLETELKEIIRERDDILKDRFDHIIEECPVLDMHGAISMEEFFWLAANEMAVRLDTPPDRLLDLFLRREAESSTVLNPFLAIPHIIIEGEGKFDILLARGREGIVFSEEAPRVHTVFLLLGTRDERPFHLRALAAIAQVAQDPNFEEKWMRAKGEHALRDVILLGRRLRS